MVGYQRFMKQHEKATEDDTGVREQRTEVSGRPDVMELPLQEGRTLPRGLA